MNFDNDGLVVLLKSVPFTKVVYTFIGMYKVWNYIGVWISHALHLGCIGWRKTISNRLLKKPFKTYQNF